MLCRLVCVELHDDGCVHVYSKSHFYEQSGVSSNARNPEILSRKK